ncbi:MAG TPA: YhjD/YihY/BrkB family envelope integrity protein [Gammaproteobacteria bacterium]|nr:YhjD/YihY/BrkB family envelope integrity protein [Gammaproteobacteria bacterium]
MTELWDKLYRRGIHVLWEVDVRTLPPTRRWLIFVARLLYVMIRELMSGELGLRAMGLVYTTLLSIVPLLAVSFSVLKAFGVHNQIEPLLYNFLAPLGAKGTEVADRVMAFVENVKVGVLGTVGLAVLIYTVISLMQKIEQSFNFVWRIDRLRSFGHRFTSYLTVILIGPVLVFTAMGITASVMSHTLVQHLMRIQPLGAVLLAAGELVPYALVWGAFTFIYHFMPNTRVRVGAAVTGGLIAALLWQSTGWLFAAFIASSSRYAAIYSSFAILMLLLIWLYLSWLILLFGAQLTFYVQHPQYLSMQRVRIALSPRLRERLALTLMFLIGYNHYHSRRPWSVETLGQHLSLPPEAVERVLGELERAGYVVTTGDDPPAYLPARDIETIGLLELLKAVRRTEENQLLNDERVPKLAPVEEVMATLDGAVGEALDGQTLRSLVLSHHGEI